MKITLFTTDESCTKLIESPLAHVTMFKDNVLELHFISKAEMLSLIEVLIKHYVLFKCQGDHLYITPEPNNYQRVRFRFDS